MSDNDTHATTGSQPPAGATDVLSTTGTFNAGLQYPIRGFRFVAVFDGLGTTSFKEVQGFSSSIEESTYREGGSNYLTVRKLPGLVTYGDITLTKGMYSNPCLYNYFNGYLEGNNFTPVNATIKVFDHGNNITAQWNVINAWPKEYSATDLSADSSDILIETLVLAHEGIARDPSISS